MVLRLRRPSPGTPRPATRRLRAAAALCTAAAIALTTGAAAPAAPARAADCLAVGDTYLAFSEVTGSGWFVNGCSGRADVTVQRGHWWGWENMATQPVVGAGGSAVVRYNCAGSGEYEYRTVINGQRADGSAEFHESNHITVTC
ncbi:hypothetical protein GCM10023205_59250 [Yinghuangia aomiensis]|uniref:CVNH domain-containing protein n=1 Tax=Yinghuangia aomiensis TaxID=676205 RepID=A0ABP9HYT6_9ACTN